jgi:trimeric autotransporter adhesin
MKAPASALRRAIGPCVLVSAMVLAAMSGSSGSSPANRVQLQRFAATPVPCTKTASPSFVAIPGEADISGGTASAVLGGTFNQACDPEDAIGGGYDNREGYNGGADASFIGGGEENQITGADSFVGAGVANVVPGAASFDGSGYYTTVIGSEAADGAGIFNSVLGGGSFAGAGNEEAYTHRQNTMVEQGSTVSGSDAFAGSGDFAEALGNGSFIGAGGASSASASSTPAPPAAPGTVVSGADAFAGAGDRLAVHGAQAFAGAGNLNTIATAAPDAAIPGGTLNSVGGANAIVIGGYDNAANGSYSTIPGGYANTAAGILTFAAGYHADAKNGGSFVWADYVSGAPVLADTAANQFVIRATGGTKFYSNEALTSGVSLAPGSGTWASLSDRNAKTGITPIDPAGILATVARMPISTWQYRSESGVRHAGPMAQDFYAAFHTGSDDRHITTIDEDGVALAAAKGLLAERDTLARANLHLNSGTAQLASTVAHLSAAGARFSREMDSLARVYSRARDGTVRADNIDALLTAKLQALERQARGTR